MAYDSQFAGLLKGIRQLLIDHNIAREPSVRGAGHPMWIDKREGVPSAGQTQGLKKVEADGDAVLGLFGTTPVPQGPYEQSVLRKPTFEIWYRVRIAPLAYELDEQIAALIMDKRDLTLPNGLWVSEILRWREIQPLGSDAQGFSYNCAYIAEIWS